jgi:hypothetical protein
LIIPKWFKPVACVIIWRIVCLGEAQFLLGKRKEDGKWALVGGSGAFWEGSKNLIDFAWREAVYDLGASLNPEKLELFTMESSGDSQEITLEIYFSYQMSKEQEVKVTQNPRAPENCGWFSLREIMEMAGRGEIAFDNDKIIRRFAGSLYPNSN